MPTWLSVTLVVLCFLWALAQFRMVLVYMNILRSAVLAPTLEPQAGLAEVALINAVSFICYGIIILLVKWPQFITYVIAFILLKSLINLVLASLSLGRFKAMRLKMNFTPKQWRLQVLLEAWPTVIYMVATVGSAWWLGY